jgi:splicing factor U2AF subunit
MGPGGMPLPLGASPTPTRVVAIFNMATPGDLTDATKHAELVEDTRGECSKYGALRSVHIPRAGEVGQGIVFLEYEALPSAAEAQSRLHGRSFDERPLTAYFFREDFFAARNFA